MCEQAILFQLIIIPVWLVGSGITTRVWGKFGFDWSDLLTKFCKRNLFQNDSRITNSVIMNPEISGDLIDLGFHHI